MNLPKRRRKTKRKSYGWRKRDKEFLRTKWQDSFVQRVHQCHQKKKKFRKKQNETGLETNISDHEGPWRKILSFSSSSSTSWVSPTFCGDGSIAESTGGRSESGASLELKRCWATQQATYPRRWRRRQRPSRHERGRMEKGVMKGWWWSKGQMHGSCGQEISCIQKDWEKK